MNRARLIFIGLFICGVSVGCWLDPAGFIVSSDVDARFEYSKSLPAYESISFDDSNFSFLVIGDAHVSGGKSAGFEQLKDRVIGSDRFVLLCGDLSDYGDPNDLLAAKNYLKSIGLPYYAVPGNHDLYFDGWGNYRGVFGRDFLSVTAGPIRVIGLDSANGTLGSKQRAWLEDELNRAGEELKIVFTHFEFISPSFWEPQQYTDIREIYYLFDLFGKHRVNYTFTGHSHYHDKHVVDGVTHLTGPAFVDGGSFVRVFVDGNTMRDEMVTE